ncbi:hypothetical protein TWF281_003138 [Arthrobotrys megalospora]
MRTLTCEPGIEHQLDGISNNINEVRSQQRNQENQTILDWLSPINPGPQQSDYLGRRQPGTGQWLLDSVQFQDWLEASQQTLFCPGIPGAGKTILTSAVIHEVETRFRNNDAIGIAYLYCDFRRQEEQKVENLLAGLLKQLVQGLVPFPKTMKSLYDEHEKQGTRLSYNEISRTFQSVVAMYSKVFIIIDALDECNHGNNYKTNVVSTILEAQAKYPVNLFATSRSIPEITEMFEGCIWLEVRAREEDVRRYLDGHISKLPKFVNCDSNLQEEIKIAIVKAVDGMFLLAQLHLDSLIGMRSPWHIKEALKTLPTGSSAYNSAYEDAMNRIKGQLENQKDFAMDVLSWITYAKRPLTMTELEHGLAVGLGDSELNSEKCPKADDMVSVCAGLVTFDKESQIIRLVHYTTQDYLERTGSYWFPNAQRDIARACITYLSFATFETGFCLTDEKYDTRIRLNPFYHYAAHNWGYHAYSTSAEVEKLTLSFLKSEAKVSSSCQVMMVSKLRVKGREHTQSVLRPVPVVHLVAYFGLKETMMILLEDGNDPDLVDGYHQTPLFWAVANGQMAVAEMLIKRGANPNARGRYGSRPLSRAVERGDEKTIQLLLTNAAKIDFCYFIWDGEENQLGIDGRYRLSSETPLCYAIRKGYTAVIKLLLENGAQPNFDNTRDTPLILSARHGNEAISKLLLDKGADPSLECDGRTPLDSAANEAIFKLLLDKRVDPDCKNKGDGALLSTIAKRGNEAMVKLLLEKDINLNWRDSGGMTPLSWAAKTGNEAIVKSLLQKGADLDTQDDDGMTPLMLAAMGGKSAVIERLIEKKARVDLKNKRGRTALSFAAEGCDKEVVELLLHKGVDPNVLEDDRTALSFAVRGNNKEVVDLLLAQGIDPVFKDSTLLEVLNPGSVWRRREKNATALVKLLLEKGVDPDPKDDNNRTPLSFAAENSDREVVELLLKKGVNPDLKDDNSRTPLSFAAKSSDREVVELLLKKGVDPNSKDSYGRTPLSYAAEMLDTTVVRLLVEKGAEPNLKDSDGRTPLWHAIRSFRKRDKEEVAKLLLKNNIGLDSKDKNGQTLLSVAAEVGHEAIVRLLVEKNAALDSKDEAGRTLLHRAAASRNEAVVRLLLEKCTDFDSKDKDGYTPLSIAAISGHEPTVRLLLAKGNINIDSKAKDGRTPLSFAAERANEAVVRLLLEKGAQPDLKDNDNRPPLRWALINRSPWDRMKVRRAALVKLLLNAGTDPDSKDKCGKTLLSSAAEIGNHMAVRLLLERGANPSLKDHDGRTPLSFVVRYKNETSRFTAARGIVEEVDIEVIIGQLLEKGVDLDSADSYGWTPLSYAAQEGNSPAVELLLKKGANPDIKDNYGQTPLSLIAQLRHSKISIEGIVKQLLDKGANPNSTDNDGRTPLSFAAQNGNDIAATLLLENGANPNSEDKDGRTPLSFVAEKTRFGSGNEEGKREGICRQLLAKGADQGLKDKDGRTALSFATQSWNHRVAKVLRERDIGPN